jgi:type II secretory pathway component GspD/PulD (secretin)
VDIHDSNMQRAQTSRSRVQALEGRPAYINSGSRIPLQTTERYYDGVVSFERRTSQLQDITRGFYVVPRLQGDEVTLEVVQHDNRPGQRLGVINTQSAGTVVRGRLGEWVELGGVHTSVNSRQGGIGQSVNSLGDENRAIRVKVECLDCEGQSQPRQDLEWSR